MKPNHPRTITPSFFATAALCLILCLTVLYSCKKTSQTQVSSQPQEVILPISEQIANWTETELASGVRKDTVVLNFKFGMSKNQVRRHTLKLHGQKKMYKVKKSANVWEYVYDMRLDEIGKVRTYFDAYYQNNKLYKIECLPRIPKDTETSLLLESTKELFAIKYGQPHFTLPADSLASGPTFLWIQGNRKIELAQSNEKVVINYIDMLGEREAINAIDI